VASLQSNLLVRASPFSTTSRDYGDEKPFDKILIANRGEIACRIIRSCKKLGIKTVAIYSDADAHSMHVRQADEAYWVGGNLSADSYLRTDRILDIVKKTGAQAIHPGYGFLSENGKFVDEVEAAGIAFIGPSSYPMHAMGDKINSKLIAKEANCFVIPGFEGEVTDEEHAAKLANEVGYPVMIKASAGGGGKGMRVAFNDDEVKEGFRVSKAEALSSFGDDRMLIERFIEDPHHIEIQVVADSHGNVVAFPERECSVQRRNQKVVEEAPSCLILPETRKAMQDQAIALCKAVGYRSAGTIEMLADEKQNFYFLEMNTRLQVEHPITELISGEDIVEHMIFVAAGRKLPERLTSAKYVPFKGSAIESRVYAEEPLRNFLPSIGPLITYKEPKTFSNANGTVRIDTGVFEGGTISQYYDPMIAKLCTYAPTREESMKLMNSALDQYVIKGLGNNITFLRSVLKNDKFISGNYSTKFIEEQYPDGFHGVELTDNERLEFIGIAAAIHNANYEYRSKALSQEQIMEQYGGEEDGPERVHLDDCVVVTGGPKGKSYKVTLTVGDTLDAEIYDSEALENSPKVVKLFNMEWNSGDPLGRIFLDDGSGDISKARTEFVQYFGSSSKDTSTSIPEGYRLRYKGCEENIIVRSEKEQKLDKYVLDPEPAADLSKFLVCPMPGLLVSLDVKEGDTVEEGQQLAIIEAMKMQNILRASKNATIKKVLRGNAGENLKVDEIILEYE